MVCYSALLDSHFGPLYRSIRSSLWPTMKLYQVLIATCYMVLSSLHWNLMFNCIGSIFVAQHGALLGPYYGIFCDLTRSSLQFAMLLY